jgi:hypothetical protein
MDASDIKASEGQLALALNEWKDAGGDVESVVNCIARLIVARERFVRAADQPFPVRTLELAAEAASRRFDGDVVAAGADFIANGGIGDQPAVCIPPGTDDASYIARSGNGRAQADDADAAVHGGMHTDKPSLSPGEAWTMECEEAAELARTAVKSNAKE